ncbi:MAG: molecular chaperone HtpG [Mycoplasmatales bacterium]
MKTKQFQAESKQLLELMIHSIYSNKDVFLRELISNASDALDKRHFYSIQDDKFKYEELFMEILLDKANKTITLSDSGLGMNAEDLENNLGTIAKSGSKEFIQKMQENKDNMDVNIIGQFGVGFYSSFIVADKVTVTTKKPGFNAFKWESAGVDSYSIEETTKAEVGTEIVLHLKDDEDILAFIDQYKIQELIKRYSDYVKYPIYMNFEETKTTGEGDDAKEETVIERKILNSQKALWKKAKKDVKKEEYNEFYKAKYHDFTDPLHVIHSKVEGTFNYELLLFIPEQKPFDYNSPTFKKGIDLYSKGILIDDTLDYLIPDCFNFVKGLVDSQDLNLNISREMLQKDATVSKLTTNIEKKIQKELLTLQKKKREEYNKLFDNFGRSIIFGMYDEYGKNKDLVKDLVMFKSSLNNEYVTLKEYVEKNKEQKEIYYAVGESIEKIEQMPTMEKIKEKEIEVLYFLNDVDEFAIKMLMNYDEKEFKSITDASIDLDSKEEKEKIEKLKEENKDLLTNLKEALKDVVSDVKLTNKLSDSAVTISGGEGLSLEMEKMLAQMPDGMGQKATKVLEINPNHPLFTALNKVNNNQEELTKYGKLLYQQAMLTEGFNLENPKEYAQMLDELIIKSVK